MFRILTGFMAILSVLGTVAQDQHPAMVLGDSLMRAGKPAKAVDQYDRAVDDDPSATHLAARAGALLAMEKLDRFREDVDRALAKDTGHVAANYLRALYAYRALDRQYALRSADRGLRGNPDPMQEAGLRVVRGMVLADMRREAEAIPELQTGLALDSNNVEGLRVYARVLDGVGDHAGSLAVVERLCTLEPKDIGHWVNRGYELAALDRHAEAISVYDKALRLDKDEPTARSNRAWSLLQEGRQAEALKDVERSLKADPSNAYAYRTRGVIHLRKGMRDKACKDLSLAKQLGGAPNIDQLIREHCGGSGR